MYIVVLFVLYELHYTMQKQNFKVLRRGQPCGWGFTVLLFSKQTCIDNKGFKPWAKNFIKERHYVFFFRIENTLVHCNWSREQKISRNLQLYTSMIVGMDRTML